MNGSAGFLSAGNWVPALAVQGVISGIPLSYTVSHIFFSNNTKWRAVTGHDLKCPVSGALSFYFSQVNKPLSVFP
jgi:hypothetical protein